ncbi:MAG: DUF1992 domain-containing protein [Nitrospirota bacterium]|jgi:DNA polymerase III delta prime subunit
MEAIARIAEERIRRAISEGRFENLENAGKPLVFDDETWIPDDLRVAYRVLKNAGVAPPELELRKEIVSLRELIDNLDDDRERIRNIRKLNYKLMCLGEQRGRPLHLEDFPLYESKVVEALS